MTPKEVTVRALKAAAEEVRRIRGHRMPPYTEELCKLVEAIDVDALDAARAEVERLKAERDEARRDLNALRADMQACSTEDERGHAIIDAADGEDPDSSSLCTLADRVGRVVAERDRAMADAAQLRELLEATLRRFYTGHTSNGADGCNECDAASKIRAALAAPNGAAWLAEHDARLLAEARAKVEAEWCEVLPKGVSAVMTPAQLLERDRNVLEMVAKRFESQPKVNWYSHEAAAEVRAFATATPPPGGKGTL